MLQTLILKFYWLSFKNNNINRGDRGIMGHGELRTSGIFLKTVSNYCPKTFFLSFLIVALYLEHQLNCAPASLLSYDSS